MKLNIPRVSGFLALIFFEFIKTTTAFANDKYDNKSGVTGKVDIDDPYRAYRLYRKNIENSRNETRKLYKAVSNNDLELARSALEAKADVNTIIDGQTNSPLFYAAGNGTAAVLDIFLRKTQIHIVNKEGESLLMSSLHCPEKVKLLLEFGHDPEYGGKDQSRTPLSAAILYTDFESIRLLLRYGADFTFPYPDRNLSQFAFTCFKNEVITNERQQGTIDAVRKPTAYAQTANTEIMNYLVADLTNVVLHYLFRKPSLSDCLKK